MTISEVKLQSTGQAGPEVNRDLETLSEKLNQAIRETADLRKILDGLTGGSSGTPPPPSGDNGDDGGTSGYPFDLVYETSRTTLAGTAEGTATEDAWTTLASGVTARYALIQFYCDGNGDTDQGTMKWRTESGSQEITAHELAQDYQTHWSPPFIVKLTAAGNFDYRTDTTAGAFTWKIYRLGYVT